MSIADQTKSKMQATVDHFKTELKNLRSNRANPGVLDAVLVEVYGATMRIKELASINVPEPRQLLISPFDPLDISSTGSPIIVRPALSRNVTNLILILFLL